MLQNICVVPDQISIHEVKALTSLKTLYEHYGQSPWIDNLSRAWIKTGRVQELKELGVRGLTSNPTIFANAISHSNDYDEEYFSLSKTMDVKSAYWKMACEDVSDAARILEEIYKSSDRADGFVSIEVDPELAHDTDRTVESAQYLWDSIDKENLMIKIPATREGLPAITEALSRGISVNVTLIFSLKRYQEVMDAHILGIYKAHEQGRDLAKIASVASFFVSRVDSKIDHVLETMGPEGQKLLGRVAVAQAQAAYVIHKERYDKEDWRSLQAAGAQIQRPLWASTSTKNPNYSDLLYVDSLIAPGTVNTMPENTLLALIDHGQTTEQQSSFAQNSREVLGAVRALGIDMEKITDELEAEGVSSFASSFRELLAALDQKKASSAE